MQEALCRTISTATLPWSIDRFYLRYVARAVRCTRIPHSFCTILSRVDVTSKSRTSCIDKTEFLYGLLYTPVYRRSVYFSVSIRTALSFVSGPYILIRVCAKPNITKSCHKTCGASDAAEIARVVGNMVRIVIILNLLAAASCFTVLPSAMRCSTVHRKVGCILRNSARFGSREEEIVKLENQLRQLREETAVVKEVDGASVNEMEDQMTLKEFEVARRRLETMKGKDMLLSEQELISGGIVDSSTDGNSSGIFGIVGAVAALVGILLFAQIPMGQDELARYSATGSSTIKSIDLGDLNPDSSRP